MMYLPLFIAFLKAAVATLLVTQLHDAQAVGAEDDASHSEEEVFHVGALLDEEFVQLVAELELLHLLVLSLQLRLLVIEADALAVAGQHVVELVLCHHHVLANLLDNLVGQLVVGPERHIQVCLSTDGDGLVVDIC